MECKKCGKEIPEGFEYCVDCENEMQEATVFKVTNKNIKKSNKPTPNDEVNIDLEGFVSALRKDLGTMMAFIGAILMYLAPFLKWAWREAGKESQSGSLFDLATKNITVVGVVKEVYTMGIRLFGFLAVIMLLGALFMLVISACDYIRSLRFLGDMIWLRLLVLGILAVAFVLVLLNPSYRQLLDAIDAAVQMGQVEGGSGAGPMLFVGGWVFSLIATICEIRDRK